jgi:hypothetical protein
MNVVALSVERREETGMPYSKLPEARMPPRRSIVEPRLRLTKTEERDRVTVKSREKE